MKKGLSVVIGSAFLVGFAATSAFATHGDIPAETSVVAGSNAKITFDGSIRLRGYIQKDTVKDSTSKAAYDGRARLGVKAALSDAATGYLQLETGDGSGDTYGWGNGNAAGLNTGGSKQVDGATDLSILQAWVNYKPGDFGVKVGHMPLALGNKMFFDHTGSGDDAVQAYMATDNTLVAGLLIKFEEGAADVSGDDINGYVALFTQKLGGGMDIGANVTNLRWNEVGMDFYNVGVDFSGKFGPAAIKADVEFQSGDLTTLEKTGTELGAAGYAVMVDATMAAGSANVGLMIGYGSGDDNAADTDNDAFVNFLTDTRYDSYMVGYRFATPGAATKNTGLSNLTMVKLHADMKTTCPISKKDLSIKAAINFMQLTEEINAGGSMEDEVGTELELVTAWTLSNGLVYKVEAAYLLAGDAYKTSPTDDPDDPYFIRNSLELKF